MTPHLPTDLTLRYNDRGHSDGKEQLKQLPSIILLYNIILYHFIPRVSEGVPEAKIPGYLLLVLVICTAKTFISLRLRSLNFHNQQPTFLKDRSFISITVSGHLCKDQSDMFS